MLKQKQQQGPTLAQLRSERDGLTERVEALQQQMVALDDKRQGLRSLLTVVDATLDINEHQTRLQIEQLTEQIDRLAQQWRTLQARLNQASTDYKSAAQSAKYAQEFLERLASPSVFMQQAIADAPAEAHAHERQARETLRRLAVKENEVINVTE